MAVSGTVVAGLGVLVFLLLHKYRQAETLKTKLALHRTSAKVAGLEADKRARTSELETNAFAAAELDRQIVDAKRATVAVVRSVSTMTDENVVDEFKKLGY